MKQLYDNVTETEVVKFIEQWMTVLGHLARYPTTNRAVAQGVHKLFMLLPGILGRQSALELSELHHLLLINGRPLSMEAQNKEAVGAFMFIMLEHNLRTVTIHHEVGEEEFLALLEMLAASSDERFVNIAQMLSKRNVINVQVEQHVPPSAAVVVAEITPTHDTVVIEADAVIEDWDEASSTAIRRMQVNPRHARTEVRGKGMRRVTLFLHVAQLPLGGAEISADKPTPQSKKTESDGKAMLFLPAGENKIVIVYESYTIERVIEVADEDQAFDIDLQKIFEF